MVHIINHTLGSTNWEELPIGAMHFYAIDAQCRTAADCRVSFDPDKDSYWSIKSGEVKQFLTRTPRKGPVYVQGTAGTVIEVAIYSS